MEMENEFVFNAVFGEQLRAAGDNMLVINWEPFQEPRVEEGRGDFIRQWDAPEEIVDFDIMFEAVRERRRRRRPAVDLEGLRRAWMELEAQESAGGPDPETTSGKRRRTEEGETSGQSKKKIPKRSRRKRTTRKKR